MMRVDIAVTWGQRVKPPCNVRARTVLSRAMKDTMPNRAAVSDAELYEMRALRSAEDLWPMLEALLTARIPAMTAFRADLTRAMRAAWEARAPELKRLDRGPRPRSPTGSSAPAWSAMSFFTSTVSGGAGDLKGVRKRLEYLADLGVTYIHFMPCLKPREGDNGRRLLGAGLPAGSPRISARWREFRGNRRRRPRPWQ